MDSQVRCHRADQSNWRWQVIRREKGHCAEICRSSVLIEGDGSRVISTNKRSRVHDSIFFIPSIDQEATKALLPVDVIALCEPVNVTWIRYLMWWQHRKGVFIVKPNRLSVYVNTPSFVNGSSNSIANNSCWQVFDCGNSNTQQF